MNRYLHPEVLAELKRIDSCEKMLTNHAELAITLLDKHERVRELLSLTLYYHREFGVHFEKRHQYRARLKELLKTDCRSEHAVDPLGKARTDACGSYAAALGEGLPWIRANSQ